jgi:hypothetical protein
VVQSIVSIVSGGTGYAVGDILLLPTGNADAIVRITNVSGGVVQSGGVSIVYGGTGYTTGITSPTMDIPPAQRTIVFSGVLTSNVTLIVQAGTYLQASRRFEVVNNSTGAFTTTVFLSNGAGGTTGNGVVVPQGTNASSAMLLFTDGVNDVWPAVTSAGFRGTATNDSAASGIVGEYIQAVFSSVPLTTNVAANVSSISLTAGDWDVTAGVLIGGSGAILFEAVAGISTTSVAFGAAGTYSQTLLASGAATLIQTWSQETPISRISISSTTTVYCVGRAQFSSGTASSSGIIRARRVR